jgi:transposase
MYILSTGCQWRYLPKDLPPRSTVHDYLSLWTWDGTLDRIHHELYATRLAGRKERLDQRPFLVGPQREVFRTLVS